MLQLPYVGEGLAFGVGKTNYREVNCDAEGYLLSTPVVTPTPETPEDFFEPTAKKILHAAHNGAKWAVLGVPGPVTVEVSPDDEVSQNFRVTNIPALNRMGGFDPVAEMTKVDPAIADLCESPDFTFLTANDGDLAAQAGARLFGSGMLVVGDVINGSGTGSALARRDTRFPRAKLFHPDAGWWEAGHPPISLNLPTLTYETTISGTAFERRFGVPAEDLKEGHPAFLEASYGVAKIALDLAIYGGAELVVVSGAMGILRQHDYFDETKRLLDNFSKSDNPMADKVPELAVPSRTMANSYELCGAWGLVRSHLTRRAIDKLVYAAE